MSDRTFYVERRARAIDLTDDDVVMINGRWRELFDVWSNQHDLADQHLSPEEVSEANQIALGNLARPDHRPNIRIDNNLATRPRAAQIAFALLGTATAEYVAVRFVRDETSDEGSVDDGWAIFQRSALVTVQVPA